MNKKGVFCHLSQVITIFLILLGARLTASERNVTRTNLTERWITNFIEVRMPKNIFVDEYHTNLVPQFVTNVVDVFATNWIKHNVTNIIAVKATRNLNVTEYKTNWNTVTLTNRSEVWRTNWETVLVMKTNWITQPVTNVVNIDLLTNRVAAAEPVSKAPPIKDAPVQPVPAVALPLSDSVQFEVSKTSRSPNRNVAELMITARWSGEADVQLQVRQWRVESENGAILCYSQEQHFRRELPMGKYRIEVKAQKNSNGTLVAARGLVDLTTANATVLPLASVVK